MRFLIIPELMNPEQIRNGMFPLDPTCAGK